MQMNNKFLIIKIENKLLHISNVVNFCINVLMKPFCQFALYTFCRWEYHI